MCSPSSQLYCVDPEEISWTVLLTLYGYVREIIPENVYCMRVDHDSVTPVSWLVYTVQIISAKISVKTSLIARASSRRLLRGELQN